MVIKFALSGRLSDAVDICQLPSHSISPLEHVKVVRAVNDTLRRGIDGIVITHGTDPVEEAAYALALQIPRGVPIVLTGAMRGDVPGLLEKLKTA